MPPPPTKSSVLEIEFRASHTLDDCSAPNPCFQPSSYTLDELERGLILPPFLTVHGTIFYLVLSTEWVGSDSTPTLSWVSLDDKPSLASSSPPDRDLQAASTWDLGLCRVLKSLPQSGSAQRPQTTPDEAPVLLPGPRSG